jgi:RHS repeat-associated protein
VSDQTGGPDTAHYYLQDANYNVTAVVNSSGAVVERYAYTPYGKPTVLNPDFSVKSTQTSAIGNVYLFTGREYDWETGLQLNRKRFYGSHLGRWVTRDPIAYRGGDMDLYGYVENSPTMNVDPTGELIPVLIGIGVGIGIWLSPNPANAPGPGDLPKPGAGLIGSEPENAVIGGAFGGLVGAGIVGAGKLVGRGAGGGGAATCCVADQLAAAEAEIAELRQSAAFLENAYAEAIEGGSAANAAEIAKAIEHITDRIETLLKYIEHCRGLLP